MKSFPFKVQLFKQNLLEISWLSQRFNYFQHAIEFNSVYKSVLKDKYKSLSDIYNIFKIQLKKKLFLHDEIDNFYSKWWRTNFIIGKRNFDFIPGSKEWYNWMGLHLTMSLSTGVFFIGNTIINRAADELSADIVSDSFAFHSRKKLASIFLINSKYSSELPNDEYYDQVTLLDEIENTIDYKMVEMSNLNRIYVDYNYFNLLYQQHINYSVNKSNLDLNLSSKKNSVKLSTDIIGNMVDFKKVIKYKKLNYNYNFNFKVKSKIIIYIFNIICYYNEFISFKLKFYQMKFLFYLILFFYSLNKKIVLPLLKLIQVDAFRQEKVHHLLFIRNIYNIIYLHLYLLNFYINNKSVHLKSFYFNVVLKNFNLKKFPFNNYNNFSFKHFNVTESILMNLNDNMVHSNEFIKINQLTLDSNLILFPYMSFNEFKLDNLKKFIFLSTNQLNEYKQNFLFNQYNKYFNLDLNWMYTKHGYLIYLVLIS